MFRGVAWLREALNSMARFCPVRLGKVLLWHGDVLLRCVGFSGAVFCLVWFGMVGYYRGIVWSSDVLFGVVGFIGVLYCKVRSYCGMVWICKVLRSVAKLCRVKYCYARHAEASLRLGEAMHCMDLYSEVLWGGAWSSALMLAKALLRWGQVWLCTVLSCDVWCGKVFLGGVEYC